LLYFCLYFALVAQRIEHLIAVQKVGGSIPPERAIFILNTILIQQNYMNQKKNILRQTKEEVLQLEKDNPNFRPKILFKDYKHENVPFIEEKPKIKESKQ
jgi:hypothetical protein